MSDLECFVKERLAERNLPAEVEQTYRRILTIAAQMRRTGVEGDLVSWFTGASTLVKVGEYVFGADAETEAARFSDQLLASLAATWNDHPDYKPQWTKKLAAK
ncbi:hypothetical protein [Brachybacterium sp. FME24]|uniref:hypothetical protein n=1 Tax=Brachybacterium sp. FME24 TaxID=2742605 RepID=UPI0018669F11|nr:hypothetical protein [Brachybacterium sp. FME24]